MDCCDRTLGSGPKTALLQPIDSRGAAGRSLSRCSYDLHGCVRRPGRGRLRARRCQPVTLKQLLETWPVCGAVGAAVAALIIEVEICEQAVTGGPVVGPDEKGHGPKVSIYVSLRVLLGRVAVVVPVNRAAVGGSRRDTWEAADSLQRAGVVGNVCAGWRSEEANRFIEIELIQVRELLAGIVNPETGVGDVTVWT